MAGSIAWITPAPRHPDAHVGCSPSPRAAEPRGGRDHIRLPRWSTHVRSRTARLSKTNSEATTIGQASGRLPDRHEQSVSTTASDLQSGAIAGRYGQRTQRTGQRRDTSESFSQTNRSPLCALRVICEVEQSWRARSLIRRRKVDRRIRFQVGFSIWSKFEWPRDERRAQPGAFRGPQIAEVRRHHQHIRRFKIEKIRSRLIDRGVGL